MGKRFISMILCVGTVLMVGAFVLLSTFTISQTSAEAYSGKVSSTDKIAGVCYGPYRDNESPNKGIHPTVNELSSDMALLAELTNSIRTYSVTDSLEIIPELCQQYGISCYPGAYVSDDQYATKKQIDGIIKIARQNLSSVKGLIIGNEVIYNHFVSESTLIEYIQKVKQSTTLPVATAETWAEWLEHPKLAESVDILFVHIYPFWDGIEIDGSATYVLNKIKVIQSKYPGKKIVIGETGWPSEGNPLGKAVPSEENQRKYLSDFLSMTKNNNIEYYYFEVFDEKWKNDVENSVGSHWGLYYSDGTVKPLLKEIFPDISQTGMVRPPREPQPVKSKFPLYVYSDGGDQKNGFYPSGWMGTNTSTLSSQIQIDESCSISPCFGKSCIKITYTPSYNSWAGIYWQYPVNNWGDYPGYSLSTSSSGVRKLLFYARGERGGEKAEFKIGGINSSKYKDSFGSSPFGVVTLQKEWTEYSVDLTNDDMSMIIGGFCWVSNDTQNPRGCTIYLDEIRFEEINSVGVDKAADHNPISFSLKQNYPNPFNPTTTIEFTLHNRGKTTLSIFSISGQLVETLASGVMRAGKHTIIWNASRHASGVYLMKLESGGKQEIRRVALVK